ncbi:MAG: cytochrome c [Anaerolineales bacterium]|nr:cytochrome c [Anaerolineales bacterium]
MPARACRPGAPTRPPGKEAFTTNCAACHGAEGHGDGPAGAALDPKPRDLSAFAPEVGDDYLFWRVNTGVPGTAMVGWKGILTDEQIWDVIAYIRTLK